MFYPEDMATDHPERFVVSEIIREKLLEYLSDEVPHGVYVDIESFEEHGSLTKISAVIICEKKSHKSIIIGKGGSMLKRINDAASSEIAKIYGKKCFLSLYVRVDEDWLNKDKKLFELGYFIEK